MKLMPQITVFLENQPGAMASVCRIIHDKNINIQAFTVFGTVDHGVLRLIVDEPESVLNLLAQEGLLAISSNVIEVPSENTPGILHEISELLSEERINIEYGYGSTSLAATKERLFLQASDNGKALELLKAHLAKKGKLGKNQKPIPVENKGKASS